MIMDKLGLRQKHVAAIVVAMPGVLCDDKAFRRLTDAAELLRRAGANASTFVAIALNAPLVLSMPVEFTTQHFMTFHD